MKRIFLTGCAIAMLAACQPQIPDSAAGVGFDNAINSPEARAQRDAQLTGSAVPAAQAVSQETIPSAPQVATARIEPAVPLATATTSTAAAPMTTAGSDADDIARETAAALAAAGSNSGVAPVDASPSNPAPQVFSNPGISDENDFAAVGERRTLQADADRQAQNKANYQVIEPGALPQRSGNAGPNVVTYALSTSHAVGTKMYSRFGFNSAARFDKNCAKYSSADLAQTEFLSRGGPKSDRMGLDPDGDGYACNWSPLAFRRAAGG